MAITRYKVTSVEVDGVEIPYPTEVGLDATNVYFNAVGYVADNVSDAIVETITKSGAARRPHLFGYDSNANTGRWLEMFKGVPSNTTPSPVGQIGTIRVLTISVNGTATTTATLYKNGVSAATITLSNEATKIVNSLNIAVVAGDILSVQITNGSCTEPIVVVEVQTAA